MTIVAKKLAIYYGYPSSVNLHYDNHLAAVDFSAYNLVVWGAGLESVTHPDHANAVTILNDTVMVNTAVYGYIDSTDSLATNQTNIDAWVAMGGALKGIFCDKFGYDFAVSRTSQNQLIDYIHSKNLKAFVNAYNPDDAFGTLYNLSENPNRDSTHLNSNDWYLAESYQIINDVYEETSAWVAKANKMQKYKASVGTNMATTTTTASGTFDQNKFDYAYFSTILYGFDAACWGEQYYSASSALLPFRSRKKFYGNKFDGNIEQFPLNGNGNSNGNGNGDIYQISTNVGIKVNTDTHTVDYLTN